jgi:hypothetical protein
MSQQSIQLVAAAMGVMVVIIYAATTHVDRSGRVVSPDPVVDAVAKLSERLVYEERGRIDGVVTYSYLTDPVPEHIVPDEVPELRTAESYTRVLGVEGSDNAEKVIMNTIAFTDEAYARDPQGAWRYVEVATTSEQAWNTVVDPLYARLSRAVLHVVMPLAHAVTSSHAPSAGDGHLFSADLSIGSCTATWSNAHDPTNSDSASHAGTIFISSSSYLVGFEPTICDYQVYRAYAPFNTSSIPFTASILSATLNVYVTALSNDGEDNDYVSVVQTSQASNTSLAVSDFQRVGTAEGVDTGQRKLVTGISTGAYLSFTLNATGLGWIAKQGVDSPCARDDGISCFGLRHLLDISNTAPTFSNQVTYSASEETGTSQDPYLSVTYTLAGPEVRSEIRGAAIRLQSGTMRLRSY